MKRNVFPILALSLLVSITACNNEEKTEIKTTAPAKETPATTPPAKAEEPRRTEIKVGENGAEVKTKSGTEVQVGEGGTKVGTKDVDIKIDPKKK